MENSFPIVELHKLIHSFWSYDYSYINICIYIYSNLRLSFLTKNCTNVQHRVLGFSDFPSETQGLAMGSSGLDILKQV